MAEHVGTVRDCRNLKMSSKEDESQSTEPAEKQSKIKIWIWKDQITVLSFTTNLIVFGLYFLDLFFGTAHF